MAIVPHFSFGPPARSSLATFFLFFIFIIFLFFHFINLSADPPSSFVNQDVGLRVDEGYKTLAARNLVLFGGTTWSDADEYTGWFQASPLTQGVMYIGFEIFEPTIKVARATALIYFLTLVFLILFAEKNHLRFWELGIIACLLATEPFLFFFSRAALFEVAMALFLSLGMLLVQRFVVGRQWLPLVAYLLCAVLAFTLVKASALLYFFPGLVVLAIFAVSQYGCRRFWLIILSALVLVGGMLFISHDIWSRRVALPGAHDLLQQWLANSFVQESPWIVCAAFLCLADLIRRRGKALGRDPYFFSLAATVLGIPFLLAFFSYAPPRYYVAVVPSYVLLCSYWLQAVRSDSPAGSGAVSKIGVLFFLGIALFVGGWAFANELLRFLPIPQGDTPGLSAPGAFTYLLPVAFCCAVFFCWLPKVWAWAGPLLKLGVFMALILVVFTGGRWASTVWLHPSFNAQDIRGTIMSKVPADSVLMGDFAPFFALGTKFPAIYSGTDRNDGSLIFELCPDYYIDSGTRHDRYALASFQSVGVRFAESLFLGDYTGRTIKLSTIQYPAGKCQK